jgi:hypothetical protein
VLVYQCLFQWGICSIGLWLLIVLWLYSIVFKWWARRSIALSTPINSHNNIDRKASIEWVWPDRCLSRQMKCWMDTVRGCWDRRESVDSRGSGGVGWKILDDGVSPLSLGSYKICMVFQNWIVQSQSQSQTIFSTVFSTVFPAIYTKSTENIGLRGFSYTLSMGYGVFFCKFQPTLPHFSI